MRSCSITRNRPVLPERSARSPIGLKLVILFTRQRGNTLAISPQPAPCPLPDRRRAGHSQLHSAVEPCRPKETCMSWMQHRQKTKSKLGLLQHGDDSMSPWPSSWIEETIGNAGSELNEPQLRRIRGEQKAQRFLSIGVSAAMSHRVWCRTTGRALLFPAISDQARGCAS
jgi:hypothetical protein